ncbi:hypothetical protein VTN02DRAFT_3057 [Thermoascus thermophilus]
MEIMKPYRDAQGFRAGRNNVAPNPGSPSPPGPRICFSGPSTPSLQQSIFPDAGAWRAPVARMTSVAAPPSAIAPL